MGQLEAQIQTFYDHLAGHENLLDPVGLHHEFVNGMHGQKVDFDTVPRYVDELNPGSGFDPLYVEWVDINAAFIRSAFPRLPGIILGVANGTNRLAVDVATRLELPNPGLESEKEGKGSKILVLPARTLAIIQAEKPELVVVTEDVGTTGSNSVQVATQALAAGAQNVAVVVTWKRREQLEELEKAGIEYKAIIDKSLPTFHAIDCVQTGLYAQGWELIPYKKAQA